ncbi:glutamyl-tRNA reductase [Kingella negevensis]|uniref:Glutamyl-tRNA reductase n=1 Tax=Kingella negevensis TaxID=1522312 RepID=A0A238TBQ3_9NEIS|nr:glutamyl-tRNA reductase [Kingella negevensis]MDK4679639.1 glutamyl-tRNA reductase [Kingella negevensis]MDK4682642.1 glutamyl-tRNA reductase [Kingella negevensis]MDK4690839.1 glutamyl-tRNA reductase [Kingella negevensis]MDK4694014.1 glutamyl-tRNA reductase [Kingella negevensis]MDK4696797.1 glutamyl-tRNA reductase [Kingella negevensis]
MKLTVIGLNHQTAPVHIREQLAFTTDSLADAVRDLSLNVAAEAVILSTCNRTELYCVGEGELIIDWLASYKNVNVDEIRPYLYVLGCGDTIRHAFRVACGLDSMVLGEPQILGQMKEAVRVAREQDGVSTWLNALFQRTFQAAKEVRSLSGVGDNVVSMASAAVRMAEQSVGDISSLNVLFVGAGEMNESVATYFAARSPKQLMVANRTLTRATYLCSKLGHGAQACKLDVLPEIVSRYDVIVVCTASQTPIITQEMIQAASAQRGAKPMFVLDLAVPRNVEPSVANVAGVMLHTVDDMAERVASGKEARAAAAEAAETMVETKVHEFLAWQQQRQRVPLICALRDEGERARQQVLNNAIRQLAKGTPPEEVLERLSVQLTNKLLHSPTRALNKASLHDTHVVSTLSQVYHLNH